MLNPPVSCHLSMSSVTSYWNHGGVRIREILEPGLSATLPRHTHVGVNASFNREVFRGVELTGIQDYRAWLQSDLSAAVGANLNLGTGRRVARTLSVPEVGEGWNASASAAIRPWQRMVIEPSISYEELGRRNGEGIFSGYLARTRLSFQYNRELNLRLVAQYNGFTRRLALEPLLVYQLDPFTIFSVGSTHASREFDDRGLGRMERQYFAKFRYLFRR